MVAMKRPASAPSAAGRKRQKRREDQLPVSTLCGFLGAGKTTLLKHILESKRTGANEFRCAVIVNDVAALNIDKSLIDQSSLVQSEDVIALQNGCVCCTLQNDLVTQITDLAAKKEFDYMLIEASGVSEPSQLAKLFAPGEEDHDHGKALSKLARLDTCVTVVDSADFFSKFKMIKQGPKCESFPQLLVEQIEYANVVILNKTDLVNKDQLSKVREQVSILNPRATVLTSCGSKIDVATVVNAGHYKAEDFTGFQINQAALGSEELEQTCQLCAVPSERLDGRCDNLQSLGELPCCRRACTIDSGKSEVVLSYNGAKLDKAGKAVSLRHSINSFIYQARRPFHPERFDEEFVGKYFVYHTRREGDEAQEAGGTAKKQGAMVSKAGKQREAKREAALKKLQRAATAKSKLRTEKMGELLRSKGFLWLGNRHDLQGVLSQAGGVLTIEFPERWSVLQAQAYGATEEVKAALRKTWVEPYGDRRQDLVFIGKDLKHGAIQDLLDRCLLTDEEMSMGSDGWKAVFGDALLDNAGDSSDEEE